MKGDFKTLLRRFCLESSILGLKYFYLYPDLFSRCFWTIAMMSIVYLACQLTWLLHLRFLEMPTRISIENQYEPLQNLTFPAITICSPNQITISAMKHLNRTLVDGNHTLDFQRILPQLLGLYRVTEVNGDELNRLQELMLLNRYNALEILSLVPQKCDDFLKLCYLKHKRYPNCKGLFNPILTMHGMCCIFNSIYKFNYKRNEKINNFVPHKTTSTGISEGLVVVSDYNLDDAMNGTLLHGGALRVLFTESTEFPAEDESSLVNPNVEAFHIFHPTYTYCSSEGFTSSTSCLENPSSWSRILRERYQLGTKDHRVPCSVAYCLKQQNLPIKYPVKPEFHSRKCYFEDEYPLPYFHHYRNSDCDVLCHARQFERVCGCIMPYVPHVHMHKSCNISSIACIVDFRYKKKQWYNVENCDCIRDCESFSYTGKMVVGNLDGLEHIMTNPYSDVEFTKSSSITHFYFQSSVYVKQKQETVISLISLSSNLGGVFGLCLGCSTISVLEIIFYISTAIRNKIKKRSPKITENKLNTVSFIY